ncbi:hypothetical protein [Mucilaginibacter sp. PAMB04168]|uniref:hypothetical protein n=1 Tax=Mucilaginibacter sp. PAMB04168 TaxID=3138567 RepID=UPI0031F68197
MMLKAVKLNGLIEHLTSTIADQEKQLKKNVETLDLKAKSVDAVTDAFTGLKDEGSKFGSDFASNLESASKGFNAMKDGLSVIKTGFQSVGGAIKATGLGLITLVLESLTKWLTKSSEGQKVFAGGLAVVGKVVEKVEGVLESLGKSIFNFIIHPVDRIKSVWNDVLSFISKQLKPFKTILQGILHLDLSQVKQGYSQLSANAKGIGQNIVSTFKKAKDGVIGFADEIVSTYKEAYKQGIKVPKTSDGNVTRQKTVKQEVNSKDKEAHDELLASQARMAESLLKDYAKEIHDTQNHFKTLIEKYKDNRVTLEQLKKEEAAALGAIQKKFQEEEAKKLDEYHKDILQIALQYQVDTKEMSLTELENETKEKLSKLDIEEKAVLNKVNEQQNLAFELSVQGRLEEAAQAQKAADEERKQLEITGKIKQAILKEQKDKEEEINQREFTDKETKKETGIENEITTAREEQAQAFARAGYATDPLYATKLINIIYQYNLIKYDLLCKMPSNISTTTSTTSRK